MGTNQIIKHRGLDLHFEWEYGKGLLLRNYNPNFNRGCDCGYDYRFGTGKACSTGCHLALVDGIESNKCILIEFMINGTKTECCDCSP